MQITRCNLCNKETTTPYTLTIEQGTIPEENQAAKLTYSFKKDKNKTEIEICEKCAKTINQNIKKTQKTIQKIIKKKQK